MVDIKTPNRIELVNNLIVITNICEKNIRMNVPYAPTPVRNNIMRVRSILVKICGKNPILSFSDVAMDLLHALDYLMNYALYSHLPITAEYYSLAFHNTLTYYNGLVD